MEILTVYELAKYLNISKATVRRLISRNAIPYFKIGGIIKFRKSSIDAWINQQECNNSTNAIQGGKENDI